MKLKTAITGLFDTVKSPALRADVVTFLRRYSDPARAVTHYSCRDAQTGAITGVLDSLGFKRDEDYAVLSSTFDPGSNSIRFKGGMMNLLAACLSRLSADWFDKAYLTVAEPDVEALISALSDTEETASASASAPEAQDCFAVRMLKKTDRMIRLLAHSPVPSRFDRNGKASYELAAKWAQDMENEPRRPWILPLPILEAYERSFTNDFSGPWLFRPDTAHMKQFIRLARKGESVPTGAFTHAPLGDFTVIDDANPVRGYFCNSAGLLDGVIRTNKTGAFVIADAPMVFAEGEDLLTPLDRALQRYPLWDYIVNIYRRAYGVNVGVISDGLRVAVSDTSQTWILSFGTPTGATSGDNNQRFAAAPKEETMTAKYAFFLTEGYVSAAFAGYGDFISTFRTPQPVVSSDPGTDSGVPDFTDVSLSKDEAAWEWFTMTHCMSQFGRKRTWFFNIQPGDSPETAESFASFRAWKAGMTGGSLTGLSRSSNADFAPTRGGDDVAYTPLSAFMAGVPLSLRLSVPGNELPFRDWSGDHPDRHGDADVIANVYSGIWTDRSPEIGADNPDGVFPAMPSIAFDFTGCGTPQVPGPAAVSRWLADMAADGMPQTRFAQRTRGTPRTAVLAVETNVDADAFLANVADRNRLGKRLVRTFCDTLLLRRNDPYSGTDESLAGNAYTKFTDHNSLVKAAGKWWTQSFSQGPGDGIDPGLVGVGYLKDGDGRLVIVFTVSGDSLVYARMCYRICMSMPLATAHVRAKAYTPNSSTVYVTADRGDFANVIEVMHKAHEMHLTADDYSGTAPTVQGGVIGPAHRKPFGRVPLGTAPTRAWILDNGVSTPVDNIMSGSY